MAKTQNKKCRAVCTVAAIINLMLFFIKLYVAVSSNSISIYVDSLNSLTDTLVCIIAIAGFYIASLSPSEKHPFGFGRSEEIVNFILSLVIVFTGAAFVYTSLQRLMYPVPIWYSVKYAVVIGCTAIVKLVMALYLKKMNLKYSSQIIKNLSIDSVLDFFTSLCIVISFTLTNYVGYSIDAVTGLLTSSVIIICGVKALALACSVLIGKKNNKVCEEAYSIISKNEKVARVSNLQCHTYGDNRYITADVITALTGADDLIELNIHLQKEINDSLNSKLYISFGGKI